MHFGFIGSQTAVSTFHALSLESQGRFWRDRIFKKEGWCKMLVRKLFRLIGSHAAFRVSHALPFRCRHRFWRNLLLQKASRCEMQVGNDFRPIGSDGGFLVPACLPILCSRGAGTDLEPPALDQQGRPSRPRWPSKRHPYGCPKGPKLVKMRGSKWGGQGG